MRRLLEWLLIAVAGAFLFWLAASREGAGCKNDPPFYLRGTIMDCNAVKDQARHLEQGKAHG